MQKTEHSFRVQKIEKQWGMPVRDLFHQWHWKENLKHSQIATKTDIPRPTITRWFHCLNIPSQSCTRFTNANLEKHRVWLQAHKKVKIKREFPWTFDRNFFMTWSREMAYVLGFLFADGYVFKNPRGSCFTCFCSTDKEIIENIRNALHSNHKIGIRVRDSRFLTKPLYVLQIGSKDLFAHLRTFGIVQNKSLTIKFPRHVPKEFLGDFIRGYFDGDGNVYFKKLWVNARKKMRWIFSTRFTSGSRPFLAGLHHALKGRMHGGAIHAKTRGHELVFSHRDSIALYNLMYHDNPCQLFLKRKYDIFQQAIRTLYS